MRLQTRTRERSRAANLSHIPGIQLNSLKASPRPQITPDRGYTPTQTHNIPSATCRLKHPPLASFFFFTLFVVTQGSVHNDMHLWISYAGLDVRSGKKKKASLWVAWSIHVKHMLNKRRANFFEHLVYFTQRRRKTKQLAVTKGGNWLIGVIAGPRGNTSLITLEI